jgi:hypothetical protein
MVISSTSVTTAWSDLDCMIMYNIPGVCTFHPLRDVERENLENYSQQEDLVWLHLHLSNQMHSNIFIHIRNKYNPLSTVIFVFIT